MRSAHKKGFTSAALLRVAGAKGLLPIPENWSRPSPEPGVGAGVTVATAALDEAATANGFPPEC